MKMWISPEHMEGSYLSPEEGEQMSSRRFGCHNFGYFAVPEDVFMGKVSPEKRCGETSFTA